MPDSTDPITITEGKLLWPFYGHGLSHTAHEADTALHYARKQIFINHITRSEHGMKMIDLLTRILVEGSAYPTLSLDEYGYAYAEWRAGKSHIYIDIDQDGIVFLYTDMEGNLRENLFSKAVLDPVAPRQALEKFTADIEALNPHWRSFF